jgi:hypothetical protein
MQLKRSLLIWIIITISMIPACLEAQVISQIVDQVSQASYTHYLDDLLYTHDGDNRGYGAEHDPACTNIFKQFNRYGLNPYLDPFSYNNSTYYNVVATHPGATRPEDIYVLGAHFDSVNNPGADDNGSGTAGVLEAARVLSQFEFEATMVFIAFDREEQGLHGSRAYAQAHTDDNILGMISLDMIAYNGSGSNRARVYGRTMSNSLKQDLIGAISLYGNKLEAADFGALGASDHAPFQDEGFQACLLIEYDSNPYYHTLSDSVDTAGYIDYAFATNMVRGAVGYLATEAVAIPEPAGVSIFLWGIILLHCRKKRSAKSKVCLFQGG